MDKPSFSKNCMDEAAEKLKRYRKEDVILTYHAKLRAEFVKEIERAKKGKFVKVKNVDEYFRKMREK